MQTGHREKQMLEAGEKVEESIFPRLPAYPQSLNADHECAKFIRSSLTAAWMARRAQTPESNTHIKVD
jgi:hypothetical protein